VVAITGSDENLRAMIDWRVSKRRFGWYVIIILLIGLTIVLTKSFHDNELLTLFGIILLSYYLGYQIYISALPEDINIPPDVLSGELTIDDDQRFLLKISQGYHRIYFTIFHTTPPVSLEYYLRLFLGLGSSIGVFAGYFIIENTYYFVTKTIVGDEFYVTINLLMMGLGLCILVISINIGHRFTDIIHPIVDEDIHKRIRRLFSTFIVFAFILGVGGSYVLSLFIGVLSLVTLIQITRSFRDNHTDVISPDSPHKGKFATIVSGIQTVARETRIKYFMTYYHGDQQAVGRIILGFISSSIIIIFYNRGFIDYSVDLQVVSMGLVYLLISISFLLMGFDYFSKIILIPLMAIYLSILAIFIYDFRSQPLLNFLFNDLAVDNQLSRHLFNTNSVIFVGIYLIIFIIDVLRAREPIDYDLLKYRDISKFEFRYLFKYTIVVGIVFIILLGLYNILPSEVEQGSNLVIFLIFIGITVGSLTLLGIYFLKYYVKIWIQHKRMNKSVEQVLYHYHYIYNRDSLIARPDFKVLFCIVTLILCLSLIVSVIVPQPTTLVEDTAEFGTEGHYSMGPFFVDGWINIQMVFVNLTDNNGTINLRVVNVQTKSIVLYLANVPAVDNRLSVGQGEYICEFSLNNDKGDENESFWMRLLFQREPLRIRYLKVENASLVLFYLFIIPPSYLIILYNKKDYHNCCRDIDRRIILKKIKGLDR